MLSSDKFLFGSIGLVLILLAGCSPAVNSDQPINNSAPNPGAIQDNDPQTDIEESNPMSPSDAIQANPGLQGFVDIAQADLSERLTIPVSEIELVEIREVIWPDASLGCPQPDFNYIQTPHDGLLIVLLGNGIQYDYHSGGEMQPFLCETQYSKDSGITPRSLTPPPSSDD